MFAGDPTATHPPAASADPWEPGECKPLPVELPPLPEGFRVPLADTSEEPHVLDRLCNTQSGPPSAWPEPAPLPPLDTTVVLPAAREATPAAMNHPTRRIEPRLRVRMPVNVWDGSRWRPCMARDVSLRGLYVETPNPVPTGTGIRLSMVLVDNQEKITVEAHVRHVEPQDLLTGRESGMGLKFDPTTPEARRRWRDFIRWLTLAYPQCERVVADLTQPQQPRVTNEQSASWWRPSWWT